MNLLCILSALLMFSNVVLASEPEAADDEDYLKNSIPKDAKMTEQNARPGEQFVVVVSYHVGNDIVGSRYYWDYEKTMLHSEYLYQAGKRHGILRTWHKNGKLKSESPYKEGQMHGTFKQWDDDGKLLGSFVMRQGTGTYQKWYNSGQLDEVASYKDGEIHGEERRYRATGKLLYVTSYKNGKLHGVYYSWEADGGFSKDYPHFYLDDEMVTREKYLKAAESDQSLPPIKDPNSFR